MGDTTTPVLGLVKPEVGSSRSTWGNKWNGNGDILDSHFATLQSQIATLQSQVGTLQSQMSTALAQGVPIGTVIPWMMYTSAPGGFLLCDGRLVAIGSYPTLWGILGTRFGGDGSSTFGVPDLRGCVLAGFDGGTGRLGGLIAPDTPGTIGGAPVITLFEVHLGAHAHAGNTSSAGQHDHGYNTFNLPGGTGFAIGDGAQLVVLSPRTTQDGAHTHGFATDYRGGGQPHGNIQVSALVMWIIRGV